MPPINLLIVDDHNLFRQGLIRILQDDDQLHVVGQAGNGQEALIQVERLQPDIVLMDLNMPVLSGPEAVRAMGERFPAIPVIMLTVSSATTISLMRSKPARAAICSRTWAWPS